MDLQARVAAMEEEVGESAIPPLCWKTELQTWRARDYLNWRKVPFSEDESLNSSSIQILWLLCTQGLCFYDIFEKMDLMD